MARNNVLEQREQLQNQRRKVDFDTYDITVDELVRRVGSRRIEIAPAYQRQFRWGDDRQSKLIESVFLGIPVPPLFMATNITEGEGQTWEVVDGLQRLLSLTNFLGADDVRRRVSLKGNRLRLSALDILTSFNGMTSEELAPDVHEGLLDRPIKVIVLNDKSDVQVRFDLFERLNTGGIRLTDQEVREAVFPGAFIDLLTRLAGSDLFSTVVNLQSGKQKDGTPQDFVLRFFAFHDRYSQFDHSVKDFLNDYCAEASRHPNLEDMQTLFDKTFEFLAKVFPMGIFRGNRKTTPVNVFEGVAVGAALALEQQPNLPVPSTVAWIDSDDFRKLTTGATNDRRRVSGRIEFARDRLLAGQ